ncbi:hypothetical protein GGI12_000940 [Dipsacomyces acuminosporus]|nr:hypothetical protein GGI12_000940 [Dipsacomyces acuminosporus]
MTSDPAKSFDAFEAYDFDHDEAFQVGLKTIPGSDDKQKLEQIKWFYYTKTIQPLDHEAYLQWRESQRTSSTETGGKGQAEEAEEDSDGATLPGAPYSASFAEVVGMIMRGEEIPGIREIPDGLNESAPSASVAKAPPKPWEVQRPNEDDN